MDKAKNTEIKSGKMQKIRDNRNNILIFLCVFIVNLIMCSAFLHPHYPHETYKIIHEGYTKYANKYFLAEGRPFTALICRLADILHIPIETFSVISFIFAIIFLSISVVIIYNAYKNKMESNSKWQITLLVAISYIVIMNVFAIEYILFLESSIMSLGILINAIIIKVNLENQKNKYIITFLLGLIAAFCYQGTLAIFPICILTYKLLLEKNTIKEDIKEVLIISILYIILMIIPLIYTKVLFGVSRLDMGVIPFSIKNILMWLRELVIKSLGVIPKFAYVGLVILTILSILVMYKGKGKITFVLKYIFVIIYGAVMCMAPIVGGSILELTPRTCISYACTIGLSLFVLWYIAVKNNTNTQKIFVGVLTLIIFIANFMVFVVITNQHLKVNQKDKENCLKIEAVIEKYEEETGIKVTKIASLRREESCQYYPGFIHAGAITRKALNTWPLRETIIFYTGRELQFELFPMEKYIQYFNGLETQEFSIKQVAIEGDTLYFYGG